MKKKIAVVVVTLAALVFLSAYFCYLQLGRDMDVVNNMSLNCSNYKEENLKVILNKVIITESKEEISENIIQHVLDNDFETIKFVGNYPNRLKVSVYKSKKDLEQDNMLFSFTYGQVKSDEIGAYDISQADYMQLEIHE